MAVRGWTDGSMDTPTIWQTTVDNVDFDTNYDTAFVNISCEVNQYF